MARFEKERTIQSLLYSRIAIVVLLVVAVLLMLSVISVFGKRREAEREAKAAETRLHDLTVRKEEIAGDIERLSTETGKEEALRERYRGVKPGEELIVIVDENQESAEGQVSVTKSQTFFQKISQFFSDLFSS
jgi:cell division protein FtsB